MKNLVQAMGALSRDMLFFHGHVASPRAVEDFAGAAEIDGASARRSRQDRCGVMQLARAHAHRRCVSRSVGR